MSDHETLLLQQPGRGEGGFFDFFYLASLNSSADLYLHKVKEQSRDVARSTPVV